MKVVSDIIRTGVQFVGDVVQYLFTKDMTFLSIDFGTVMTKAAIYKTRDKDKKPKLIEMFNGFTSMPTAVFYDNESHCYKVGEEAIRSRITHPDDFHNLFKPKLSESSVVTEKYMPWVVEILKFVILRAIQTLEVSSPNNTPILFDKIILTVPSSTIKNDNRWQFMLSAISKAIYDVESERGGVIISAENHSIEDNVIIIKEPEAAGYSIARDQLNTFSNGDLFLVYDMGGGTFDPALLEYRNGTLRCIGEWDSDIPRGKNIGGTYIDEIIKEDIIYHANCEIFAETLEYFSQYAIISEDGQFIRPDNISRSEWRKKKSDLQELDNLAIEAKHSLSNLENNRFYKNEDDDYEYELLREDYYDMIEPLIDDSIQCCSALISDYGYQWKDIKQVFLVGGSSQIPLVRDRLNDKKNQEEADFIIVSDIDYLHAVALGAAVYEDIKPTKQQREEFGMQALKNKEWSEAEFQFTEGLSNYGLGLMEYEGAGMKKLYKNAYKIFAADLTDPKCKFMQALMLFYGQGIKKDDVKALEIIEKMLLDAESSRMQPNIKELLISKGTILSSILKGDGKATVFNEIYSDNFYNLM